MNIYPKICLDMVANFAKKYPKYEGLLEWLWNTKWKQNIILYNAQGLGAVDVKDLLSITADDDIVLRFLVNNMLSEYDTEDEKVIKIAKFVNSHLTYTSDIVNYDKREYWADPYTVYERAKDDCDGFAFLILKMMELAGIPAYRRKICAGDTRYGGHAYIIYLSREDNNWYVIEGSLKANESFMSFGIVPHSDRYDYGDIWFTFNEEKAWSQTDTLI